MTEHEIKATIVKAMDENVSDDEAKAAFAGVLAHVAHNSSASRSRSSAWSRRSTSSSRGRVGQKSPGFCA
ncbi:hypothetical protein IVB34_21775 [Bradyrhizobium sp. 2]|uniref:hypothetical protein n=1 Tax=Bradyrhizobium sp. 2 TaxID=190045 RepID=UPI001FFADF58|nr:hypothetical protein [Bradyrhizobium sp. 2]MCK1460917.1 hypothetical protein [Bradyrhizobium sp. 2]